MPIPLDLSALENAINRLDAGLVLKRYLEMSSADPSQFDAMPFADLIRTANEQGLLKGDWNDWRVYREMRSKTSHTYDEAIAVQVVKSIPGFLEEAKALLKSLQERIA